MRKQKGISSVGMFSAALLIGLVIGLSGCSKKSAQVPDSNKSVSASAASNVATSTPTTAGDKEKFQKIAGTYLLGIQQAYLESIAGPAETVDGDERVYEIDGCRLTIYSHNGKVEAFRASTQIGCEIDLSQYNWPKELDLKKGFTFGDFLKVTGPTVTFSTDCLDCGNAHDPYIQVHAFGAHVIDYIEFAVVGPPDDVDHSGWAAALGADYKSIGNTTCDPRFQAAALKLTRNVKVENVYIGKPLRLPDEAKCKPSAPIVDDSTPE